MKSYPKPSVTVDMVAFNRKREVLLIKRRDDPFKGCWALPGGYVNKGEDIMSAALRELREETRIKVDHILTFPSGHYVPIIGSYGKIGRDPRGWVISVAFACYLHKSAKIIAGDDAIDWKFFHFLDLPAMAFDHAEIITDSLWVWGEK